jgi:RHS repeat-associated protein
LRKTETIYDDPNLIVTVKKDLNSLGDGKLQVSTQYDQLGRSVLSRSSEPGNADGIKVKSTYYPLVNRTVHSSPFRTTSDATLEWTCTQSDASHRVVALAIFRGSEPTDCASTTNRTGFTATVYDANQTTVTDPASKQNRQIVDGLGRLTQVIEDPNGLNYSTTYVYDTVGNLTQVNQGVQTRNFAYSTLGRLLSATNPESGTINYAYFDSGDLHSRSDARGFVASMTYDAMHRILTKSYLGDGGVTPNVTYSYYGTGSTAPNIGQLQSMSSTAATVNYGNYDILGRMGLNTQTTNGNAYTFQYTYRLNDSISSMQYPSGKTINYSVDDGGRINKVSTSGKAYTDLSASNAPFTADGRIAQMRLGNDLWESRVFHTPGSPTLLKLGTTAGANDKLELEYDYPATSNNGNLATQVIRQAAHTWTQNYTYDSLNRLATATETNGYSRTYGYDRYGNRWVASSSGIASADSHEPTVGTLFNTANNRLANQSYDAAGNQTSYDPRTLAYDAESRMISATSPINGNEYYLYDGDGRRVRKTWTPYGGTTQSTTYVYGPGGQLAVEYTNQISPSTGTSWMFTDLLGSVRALTGEKPQSGAASMTECYDYLPFGRILSSSDNNRNTGCYPASPDFALSSVESPKFTGKSRDTETGLDYFGARYYSAAQGRFISSDGLISKKEWVAEPPRWNRYTYGLNNPTKYLDPDGKDAIAAFFLGPQYRDVSTFKVLCGNEALSDYKKAWNTFLDDHRILTHGLSPFPTSKGDVAMQVVVPLGGKAVGSAADAIVKATANKIGQIVLGKFPRYLDVADELGAKKLDIPGKIWEKMSEEDRWVANKKFLDRAISRGDEIILSEPVKKIDDESGFFRRELDYLKEKGFNLMENGTRMAK